MMPFYFYQEGIFDEVIIWRLTDKPKESIIFEFDNRRYIQKWVKSFDECFKEKEKPDISFFRGGFKSYCEITKKNPKFFGLKLYLGSSKRVNPVYGGIYDYILVEDNSELSSPKHLPFFKTASPDVFYPIKNKELKYDICWPCNFTQIGYKGQEYFIQKISNSKYLKTLQIVHCGNKPELGKQLCKKYNVNNIEFIGSIDRRTMNELLNKSKLGLVTSNKQDGCPRVLTEVLMAGTPLLVRDTTRFLNFYKKIKGVFIFDENNLEKIIFKAIKNLDILKQNLSNEVQDGNLNFIKICKKNLELWK